MYFVTGGTGLLGNCIVRELCNRQMQVRVLCRQPDVPEALADLPVEIVSGDLETDLDAMVEGCDAVIHSAAFIHIGWQKLEQSRRVNVGGTERIVQACAKADAKLLHISTVDTLPAARSIDMPIDEGGSANGTEAGVDKVPCSYVISKMESQKLVEEATESGRIESVILNPGFMLGRYDWKPSSGRMMLEVAKAPLVVAPPGGCSVCDARDVAIGVVNALETPSGQQFILAGENLPYQDFWQEILKTIGSKKKAFKLGPFAKHISVALDWFNKVARRAEGDLNSAAIKMGYLGHYYDSSKAERELGYVRRPLVETLQDAWNWLNRHSK